MPSYHHILFPIDVFPFDNRPSDNQMTHGSGDESPYDVLTLYRESDRKCVIRLRGYGSDVFWKEIDLIWHWWQIKSPRERILEAQQKAQKKAEKLRWLDMQAQHEYNSVDNND